MGSALSRQVVCVVVLCVVQRGSAFAPTSSPLRGAAPLRARAGPRAGRLVARMVTVDAPPVGAFPDLTDALPDCPPTVWNAEGIDLGAELAAGVEGLPTCPLEWNAEGDKAAGAEYFAERSAEIQERLREHGCVWFRGFDLMKDTKGFRSFYEALGDWAEPCLDPIHTSGLRAFADAPNGVYMEVNKQSLSRHYIGLHNESTEKKTAAYGAFVCFEPASVDGGEFMIADGARILRSLDRDVLERIYERGIRISVSNLDFGAVLDPQPPFARPLVRGLWKQIVASTIAPKFDMELEMQWGTDGNPDRMQAVEGLASPINRHPKTGLPVWFCNIHNHARFLRDRRQCNVPEVGMTDVYYGDLTRIPPEDLLHINEVSEASIARIPMQPGDVLLCDNYRVSHGRDVFNGDRYHAVSWFREAGAKYEGSEVDAQKPGNVLNKLINSAF